MPSSRSMQATNEYIRYANAKQLSTYSESADLSDEVFVAANGESAYLCHCMLYKHVRSKNL